MKIFNRQYFSGQATLLQHYITNLCTRGQNVETIEYKKMKLKIKEMGKTLIFRRFKIEF